LSVEVALLSAAALSSLVVGVVAVLRSGGRPGRLWFGIGAVTVALWALAVAALSASPSGPVAIERARVCGVLASLLPVPWAFAVLTLAREEPRESLRRFRGALVVTCGAAAAFAWLSVSGWIPLGVGHRREGYAVLMGPAGRGLLVYLIAALVFMLFGIESTIRAAGRSTLRRVRFTFIGLAAAMVYCLYVVSTSLLYAVVRVPLLAAGAVPILAAVGLSSYSVAHRRLSDSTVRVGRPVFYASVTAALVGVYLLALGGLGAAARAAGWGYSTLTGAAMAFLAALLLLLFLVSVRARRRIRRFVDANFYMNRYDHRREWLRTSRSLGGELTEAEIVERARELVTDTVAPAFASAFAVERTPGGEWRLRGRPGPLTESVLAGPLFDLLESRGETLRTSPDDAEPGLHRWVEENAGALRDGPALAVPLAAAGRLVGVLLVGRRESGRYTSEDLDLLTAIGTQAGNAMLAARLGRRLAASAAFESVHRLSSFVVHDLKNCVSGLSLTLTNAETSMDDPEFRSDLLDVLADTVDSIRRVVDRVTAGARVSVPAGASVHLADVVQRALERTGLCATPDVTCLAAVDRGLTAWADETALVRVVENLLTNAVEAMDGRGTVGISARTVEGGRAELRVEDSGPGIDPGMLSSGSLFEPFETTGGGTGLGLFQCRSIVETYGGTITAENGERGAIFRITLPVGPGSPPGQRADHQEESRPWTTAAGS